MAWSGGCWGQFSGSGRRAFLRELKEAQQWAEAKVGIPGPWRHFVLRKLGEVLSQG